MSQLYNYHCMTPVTEEIARLRAKTLHQQPLSIYDLPEAVRDKLRAAPAIVDSRGAYDDPNEDDFDPEDCDPADMM